MKWEITDFDIVSPTSRATETDALALTQNLGAIHRQCRRG